MKHAKLDWVSSIHLISGLVKYQNVNKKCMIITNVMSNSIVILEDFRMNAETTMSISQRARYLVNALHKFFIFLILLRRLHVWSVRLTTEQLMKTQLLQNNKSFRSSKNEFLLYELYRKSILFRKMSCYLSKLTNWYLYIIYSCTKDM